MVTEQAPELLPELLRWLSPLTASSSFGGRRSLPKGQGAGFGSAETNRQVEARAVEIVTKQLRADGWVVKSVESDNVGYDLECSRGKERRHVEVKGVSGDLPSCIITANEYETAKRDPKWWIHIVTQARSSRSDCFSCSGQEFVEQYQLQPISYRASRA